MISDIYFCSDNVRISVINPVRAVGVMPVRKRLMKAVFFLSDESRELLTSRISGIALVRAAESAGDGLYLCLPPRRGH